MRPAVVALLAAVGALVGMLGPAQSASAQERVAGIGGAPQELAGCAADRISVVMLVDVSGSIKTTDPDARRVEGLKGALFGLSELVSPVNRRGERSVEVRFAGFAGDIDPSPPGGGQWLDLAKPGDLERAIEGANGFANRHKRRHTNLDVGLVEAQRILEERAEEFPGSCQAVVMFTDDQLDVPGDDEGDIRRRLCEKTVVGLAARPVLRFMVAVGDKEFPGLRAIAVGGPDGYENRDCGGKPDDVRRSGFFVTAKADDLYEAFTKALVGERAPPRKGDRSFTVHPGIKQFVIDAELEGDGHEVTLVTPLGEKIELKRGTRDIEQIEAKTADAVITASWISKRHVRIDGVFTGQRGKDTWEIRFPDDADPQRSTSAIRMLADVQLNVVAPDFMTVGEAARNKVRFRLTDEHGATLPDDSALAEAAQTTISYEQPGSYQRADISTPRTAPGPQGFSVVDVVPPESWGQGPARLTAVTTFDIDPYVVVRELVKELAVPARNPEGEGFPRVLNNGEILDLGTIYGTEQGEGIFIVRASPDRDGCVWLAGGGSLPRDVKVEIEPRIPARGKPCSMRVRAGAQRAFTLKLRSTDSDSDRRVAVSVPLLLSGDPPSARFPSPRPARVEASAQVFPEQNTLWKLFITVALVALGLGIPLATLMWLNQRQAVFPRTGGLRLLSFPVAFDRQGQLADGIELEPVTATEDLPRITRSEDGREISGIDGLLLETHAPFSRVFAGPGAVVRAAAATTTPVPIAFGQQGRIQASRWALEHHLGLRLEGAWIFVYGGPSDPADGAPTSGMLHVIVREFRDEPAAKLRNDALIAAGQVGAPSSELTTPKEPEPSARERIGQSWRSAVAAVKRRVAGGPKKQGDGPDNNDDDQDQDKPPPISW